MNSIEEIYYFNKALDGKDIYGLSPMLNNLYRYNEEKIIEKLKQDKLLDMDGSINKLSYLLIKAIKQYKEADKYIRINRMLVAVDQSDNVVIFKRSGNNLIDIQKMPKEYLIFLIINQYEFLHNCYEVNKSRKLDIKEFLFNIMRKKNDSDILSISIEERKKSNKVLFFYEEKNKLFRYSAFEEELKEVTSKDIKKEIADILQYRKNKGDKNE